MKIMPKKYGRKPFVFVLIFLYFSLFLTFLSFAETVIYQYDSLNRLTGAQYENGAITKIEYSYDAAGNILTKKVVDTQCPECSDSPVELTNVTFTSACECSDSASITIGTGVKIKSGATVIFKAPTVKIQSGFHAEEGATVNIKQQ